MTTDLKTLLTRAKAAQDAIAKLSVTFTTPYDAGYDCGKNGADTSNSHFAWFLSLKTSAEWQRGNDAALAGEEKDG